MKKLALTFVLLITLMLGNPIDPFQFYINEVFLTDSSWVIEIPNYIQYEGWPEPYDTLANYIDDTLKIVSSTDSILYPLAKAKYFGKYCCLYSDSVNSELNFNAEGDRIYIQQLDSAYHYYSGQYHGYLSYGEKDSRNPCIIKNSSLSRETNNIYSMSSQWKYYTDTSPTLGGINDSIGGCGTIVFNITDKNGWPMPGYTDNIETFNGEKAVQCLATYNYFYFNSDYCSNYVSVSQTVKNDSTYFIDVVFPTTFTSIEDKIDLPSENSLSQNYPNPFNPSTTFTFNIPMKTNVELSIFDIQGKLVEKLVNEMLEPGEYHRIWNASQYSSGVYIYQLKTTAGMLRKKCILVK